jgi:hypothetical protein
MSTVDEVKERIDIVDVVGETVAGSPKNYTGFALPSEYPHTGLRRLPRSGTWRVSAPATKAATSSASS